ncbi:hypothetical protein GUT184_01050 [Streptococcus ruminantium]|nr:hypothetical protein GUT183_01080 [Streptococcus ruminantium]BDD39841.1 hypothetical protein GUT184_01050 [Streptococcus ruminantium]BDD41772.1 hypothetical protein GUT189_01050 [Streptococcus ruminantium]
MVEGGFRLDILLTTAQLARATYYYQLKQLEKDDKDKELKQMKGNYGYRWIHLELRNRGFCVNHKKVQRLMQKWVWLLVSAVNASMLLIRVTLGRRLLI